MATLMTPAEERALDRLHPASLSPAKLAHVVIRSDRFEEARDWYLKVLNATVSYGNDQVCFMTYDDEHHRVGILRMPPGAVEAPANATGLEHIAFTYPTLGALLATYRRLKADGIEPFWPINHGPTISLYYRDPHGMKLELQFDVFETPEQVDAYMSTGNHERNFIGIVFDPEDLATRFERGESIESLTHRPELPEGMTPFDMIRH